MSDPERLVIHLLREGRALCGRPGIPAEWSSIERWVSFELAEETCREETPEARVCTRCRAVHETGKAKPEKSPVVVADRTGQVVTLWCTNCGDTFTFHLPCNVSMVGVIVREYEAEHERCGEACPSSAG